MKQYLDLVKAIKEKGTIKLAARENMPGTVSLFGYQFRHNLAEGFPLITTKKINFKHIVTELIWFLKGYTNIKYLVDNGCNIWNEDAYNYYLKIKPLKSPTLSFEEFILVIKTCDITDLEKWFENGQAYVLGDCGVQYGKLWKDWDGVDQVKDLIEGLKNSPMSRRHIITAWNPSTLDQMALNACHCLVQFNCRPISFSNRALLYAKKTNKIAGGLSEEIFDNAEIPKYYLDCQMYQRSADVFLGVPFNIASYALLTEMLSKMLNMVPGDFVHTFGDAHIYGNHIDQVNLQFKRKPKKLPELAFGNGFDSLIEDLQGGFITLDDFTNQLSVDLFHVENYNPHPRIKGKLSTGLK
jgi:thymidylate synthase